MSILKKRRHDKKDVGDKSGEGDLRSREDPSKETDCPSSSF
jgi:hypothetical protein